MRTKNILTWFVFLPTAVTCRAVRLVSPHKRGRTKAPLLVIEAGKAGWDEPAPGLLDIEQSAREYIGEDAVVRLSIERRNWGYLAVVGRTLSRNTPTHYFYDTRTGHQGKIVGWLQAFAIATLLSWYDVVPITLLTNFPARKWRRQVVTVTASRGLILLLMDPGDTGRSIPHNRVLGPVLMPFSEKRLRRLRSEFPTRTDDATLPVVLFIGTMYEPRQTKLNDLGAALAPLPLNFKIISRNLNAPKITEGDYWGALRESNFVVTTADHARERGSDNDFPPHLVYRYTEALVAETCLIAPRVPGPLTAWTHYIPYDSADQLKKDLASLRASPEKIGAIREAGANLIAERVASGSWWQEVDFALGPDALK